MIQFKLKQYLYGTLFLSALLITACQKDEITDDTLPDTSAEGTGDVVLNFTVAGELSAIPDPTDMGADSPEVRNSSISTRTNLPGSDNIQHVNSVQLYIFNGTSDNAVCVASEDVGWTAYFGGTAPTVTSTLRYRVKYSGLVKDNPYTFLAVGTDDTSRTTYGFPASIQVNSTTLGNAIATLAGTEATTWTSMRQSEFFAGSTVLTPSSYGTQGNVNLWRRVAGVMGWFNNVPTLVGPTTVSNIRITLYTQQNKRVPLLQRSQTPVFKDYIASPLAASTGGQVLVQIPVPAGTLPITVLSKGSYVLPIPAPAAVNLNDYTLKVELTDTSGNVLSSKRVTLSGTDDSNSSTGGGTGVIDPQGVYRFPIVANRFYGIGTKTTPINMGGSLTRSSSIRATVVTDWKEIVDK